jgi:uncharacterized membrane protein
MANWMDVNEQVFINKKPEEVYKLWRNLEGLPLILSNVRSVTESSGKVSHWVVKGPLGSDIEWDAEVTTDEPGKLLAWNTVGDPDVKCTGTVTFVDLNGGCNLGVHLRYLPPAGVVGTAVATLFGVNPEKQVAEDLERFKDSVEAGTFGQGGHAVASAGQ